MSGVVKVTLGPVQSGRAYVFTVPRLRLLSNTPLELIVLMQENQGERPQDLTEFILFSAYILGYHMFIPTDLYNPVNPTCAVSPSTSVT